jgi:hypothetical protein
MSGDGVMFIELGRTQINLDHVKEVHTEWAKDVEQRRVTVFYADGSTDRFRGYTCSDFSDLESLTAPVVAAPGFHRLCVWFYDDDPSPTEIINDATLRDPVVAWRIKQSGPIPIGMDNSSVPGMGGGEEAILRPDGVVTAPGGDQWWKDINAWAEYVCAEWKNGARSASRRQKTTGQKPKRRRRGS